MYDRVPSQRLSRRLLLLGAAVGAVSLGLPLTGYGVSLMAKQLYTRCSFGAYADNTAGHEALEKRVGAKLKRYVTYQDLPSVGGGDGWPQTDADWCARTGHDLVIAWDIHSNINLNGDQLLRGEINTQLNSFFKKAKAFPNKVVLRMWWEFNEGMAARSARTRLPGRGGTPNGVTAGGTSLTAPRPMVRTSVRAATSPSSGAPTARTTPACAWRSSGPARSTWT